MQYATELKVALEQNDRARARELSRWREDQFRALLDFAETADARGLSLDDFAALAECCEYVKEPELSIRYARFAIQADARDERAYFSLIRSLLNLERTDEADAEVWRIAREFPENSRLRSLHGLMFAGFRFENQIDRALPHADAKLEYDVSQSFQEARSAETAAQFVPEFLEAYEAAGRAGAARRVLAGHLATVRESIASWSNEPGARPEDQKDETVSRRLSLLFLNCELTHVVEPERLVDEYARWLAETMRSTRSAPEVFLKSYNFVLNYAVRRAPAFRGFAPVRDVLRVANGASAEGKADAAQPARFEMMTEQYEELIDQLEHHRSLVGRPTPDWSGVEWLTLEDTVPASGALLILEFWAPFSGRGLTDLQRLSEWKSEFCDDGVQIVAVAPHSGFTWDPETMRAQQMANIDRDAERSALTQCLRQLQIEIPVGLVSETGDLAEGYAVRFFPVHVLIDREGCVQEIVTGNEPGLLRYFVDSVHQHVSHDAAQAVTECDRN